MQSPKVDKATNECVGLEFAEDCCKKRYTIVWFEAGQKADYVSKQNDALISLVKGHDAQKLAVLLAQADTLVTNGKDKEVQIHKIRELEDEIKVNFHLVQSESMQGDTPLMAACRGGHEAAVRLQQWDQSLSACHRPLTVRGMIHGIACACAHHRCGCSSRTMRRWTMCRWRTRRSLSMRSCLPSRPTAAR